MKKIYLIILLTISSFIIYAQQTYELLGQIEYIRITDLLEGSELNGLCKLYIGKNESLFVHLNTPKESKIIEESFVMEKISADKDGFPIYINLANKTYVEKTTISNNKTITSASASILFQFEKLKK